MVRRLLLAIAIILMVFSLIECKPGSDPEPDPKDAQLEKLVATWNCTGAVKDGVAQVGYNNFKLMLSGTAGSDSFTYSNTGRPALSPWPANGTWQFGSSVATDLTRDSNLPVTYSVTGTQLELTFNYSGTGFTGRTTEVNGQWVFNFSK
jgi:hypothetical protein